jgi:antitoxin component YwqK of YwqJK toxin-antitoxin module
MKVFRFILFLLVLISAFSCKVNKLTVDQMLAQDKFECVRIGDQLYEIKVNSYDSASYYDSPYQRYMLDNSNKPDGKLVIYDEKGRIRRTLFYKEHKREGPDTWYYADGQIMQEKEFVHDRLVSYKTFYPKRLMVDLELSDTLGIKKHYDEEGNLQFEKNYVTGAYKEWYPDGKVKVTGMQCPGECFSLFGPWNYYNESGKLDQIVFYPGTTDLNNWDSIYHYKGNKIVSIERK